MISIFTFKDGYKAIGEECQFKTFLAPINKKANDEYIKRVITDLAVKYFTKNPDEQIRCYNCNHCDCWSKSITKFKNTFVKEREIPETLNDYFQYQE
jgi:hypothetical protein